MPQTEPVIHSTPPCCIAAFSKPRSWRRPLRCNQIPKHGRFADSVDHECVISRERQSRHGRVGRPVRAVAGSAERGPKLGRKSSPHGTPRKGTYAGRSERARDDATTAQWPACRRAGERPACIRDGRLSARAVIPVAACADGERRARGRSGGAAAAAAVSTGSCRATGDPTCKSGRAAARGAG